MGVTSGPKIHTVHSKPDPYTQLLISASKATADGTQTFTDSSRNNRTISYNGSAQWESSDAAGVHFFNSSIEFDGTDDYLTSSAYNFLNNSWTTECWFYYDTSFPGTVEGLIALDYDGSGGSVNNAMNLTVLNGAMALYVSSDGMAGGSWDIVNGTTGGTVAATTWHHAAAVFDGSTYKVYLNGDQVISVSSSVHTGSTDNSRIIVGTTADSNSGQSWNGYIDEIRVSSIARYTENFTPSGPFNFNSLILCLDTGLNRSTNAMADAGHPTDNEGIEEDYQPTGCKLITRADKTITQGNDLRPYDSNGSANWTGAVTGGGAYFTKVSGSSASLFYGYMSTSYGYTSNPVVGRRYRIVVRAKTNTGGGYLRTYDGAGGYPLITTSVDTTMKTYTFDFTCQHATGCFIYGNASYADGQILYIDRYEVYELTPWLDVSGRGNNATPELGINGLTIESGTDKRGQGLKYFDFDGTDDKISVPHNSDFTAAKTWACWFNLDVIPISSTFDNLFSSTDNWNQAGGISMQFIYGSFTWSWGSSWGGACQIAHSTLSTGAWYHVVGTSDGTTGTDKVKMYLNGELKDTGTASQIPDDTNPNNAAKIYIGSGNGGSMNGQIATFQVYTAELTHKQIKDTYNSQRSRFGL